MFQGEAYGRHFRFWSGKILLAGFCAYSAAYYLKYNGNVSCLFFLFKFSKYFVLHFLRIPIQDWTRKGGWRVLSSRKSVNQNEVNFPVASDRSQPSDYASRGFKDQTIL